MAFLCSGSIRSISKLVGRRYVPPKSPVPKMSPLELPLVPRPFVHGRSIRVGAIGYKQGMTSYFDPTTGARMAATVLWLNDCQALWSHSQGRSAPEAKKSLDVGAGFKAKPKNIHIAQRHYFQKCNARPKTHVKGFQITSDALVPPGTPILAAHFVPGQYVDVQAKSIGKGFQGAMKRWHFKGLPASHGVSVSHRSLGATGARQDPGKVFKGKKMPGRMGGKTITTIRLKVLKIDTKHNCLFIKGAVPGPDHGAVRIKDSHHNPLFKLQPPPFPTFIPNVTFGEKPLPRELIELPHHKTAKASTGPKERIVLG